MRLPIHQIDAFADRRFAGNPAAVVPLDWWPEDSLLQAIASENNLSETAFLRRSGDHHELRWFTPATEVTLCGHATLAAAYVVLTYLEPRRSSVAFETLSGRLLVRRQGEFLSMDFPGRPGDLVSQPPAGLASALGIEVNELWQCSEDLMVVLDRAEAVADLEPEFSALGRIDCRGVIVTAAGVEGCDFVSRFFGPRVGVPEDPVTGSAHCALAPYWADRLGKDTVTGRQLSRRGGEVRCKVVGDRVELSGRAVPYLSGFIEV